MIIGTLNKSRQQTPGHRLFPLERHLPGAAALSVERSTQMKIALPLLTSIALLAGCAHEKPILNGKVNPPWRTVGDGVSALVDQHAEVAAFERFRDIQIPAERLDTFASIQQITSEISYSAKEREEQKEWFRSAISVWHYTFECQFEAILFIDATGRVQHAMLLG